MRKNSITIFAASLFFAFAAAVHGQDLGSGNGLFRSPNPKSSAPAVKKNAAPKPAAKRETTAKREAAPKKTATARTVPKPRTTPKPSLSARNSAGTVKKDAALLRPAATAKIGGQAAKNAAGDVVITVGQPAPPAPPSENFNEAIEKSIEEGNRARDERDYAKAEAAYLRAQSLSANDARAVYGLGNILSDQQRWEEAETAYRTAIRLEPGAPESYIALSFVLTQPIAGSDLSDRYAEAERDARRALELDSQNPLAYDQLGVALELRGMISGETENVYRKAIALDPEFALAYAHLGRLLRRRGMINESAAAYRSAIQLSNDVPTMILIADVMQSQQRYTESEQLLRRALRQDAKNPTALLLLGRALTTRGSYDEAESVLKKSAEVSPNSFVSYLLLGSLYARRNELDDAEKSLRKALKIVSANEKKRLAQEFEIVGDGYLRGGKSKDAARAYRQALELDKEKSVLAGKILKAQNN